MYTHCSYGIGVRHLCQTFCCRRVNTGGYKCLCSECIPAFQYNLSKIPQPLRCTVPAAKPARSPTLTAPFHEFFLEVASLILRNNSAMTLWTRNSAFRWSGYHLISDKDFYDAVKRDSCDTRSVSAHTNVSKPVHASSRLCRSRLTQLQYVLLRQCVK